MTVYLVTTGEYEEFTLHSIWDSREKAEAACAELDPTEYWADRTRIVPVELNGPAPDLWDVFAPEYFFPPHSHRKD